MTRISAILPCYNNAAHLADAIESVLRQSIRPDEILVIDDGSRDASMAVAARFGERVRLFGGANHGVSAARNRGVAESSGSLLAFLDADDLWPETSLEARLATMERSGADVVFGKIGQFHDKHGANRLKEPPVAGRLAGSLLVRRAVFDRVGLFDERLATAETIDWIARCQAAGIVQAACAQLVLLRRIHGDNLMIRTPAPEADCFHVLRGAIARRRAAAS